MKLCNLFLYKVKDVSFDEVCNLYNGDIREGIIKSLGIECSDKLYLYKIQSTRFIPLPVDEPLTSTNSSISDTSTIVAVDMHSLGQSSLKEHSFGENLEMIEEKHEALLFLHSFHEKIVSDKNLRGSLAIDCRNNRSIERHLNTSYENTPPTQILDSLPDLKKKPDSSQCDHLISVSKSLTQQTCSILHHEISLHSWIDILDQGGHIKRSVEVPRSCPVELVEVIISSDVFEKCRTWDGTPNTDLTLLGEGGFAKTFKYDCIATQSNLVISVVIKQNSTRDQTIADEKPVWYREACHTRQLCHDNIIKYFDKPIRCRNYYYCIMEYGGISLNEKYYRGNVNMKRSDICTAMLHIAQAINYIHHHNMENVIIHRDIRTCNVLVSDSDVYKLIDFGISSEKCQQHSRIESDTHFGNFLWKSPEYCQYILEKYMRSDSVGPGRKSDIWMFGVFTMEMISFPEVPQFFVDYNPRDFGKRYAFLQGLAGNTINLIDKMDESCDPAIREVVEGCLEYSENDRVDSQRLVELCQQFQL